MSNWIFVGDLVYYADTDSGYPTPDPYVTTIDIPYGAVGLVVKMQDTMWNGKWVDVLFHGKVCTLQVTRLVKIHG